MTGLEGKVAIKATVTLLRQLTMAEAAATLGASYNHMILVLAGERRASKRLQEALADFVGYRLRRCLRRPHCPRKP